jgi:hypothetical protein
MSDQHAPDPPAGGDSLDRESPESGLTIQQANEIQMKWMSQLRNDIVVFTYAVKLFVISVVENIPSKELGGSSPKRRPDLPGFPYDLCIPVVVDRAERLYQLVRIGPDRNGCDTFFEPTAVAFAWVKNTLNSLLDQWGWETIRSIPDPSSDETASRAPGSPMPCSEYSYCSSYVYYVSERERVVKDLSRDTRRRTVDTDTLTSLRTALEMLRQACRNMCITPGEWPYQREGDDEYLPPYEDVFSDTPHEERYYRLWFGSPDPGSEIASSSPIGPSLHADATSRDGRRLRPLSAGAMAVAAGYELLAAGEKVTIAAVAARAGVDRSHLHKKYPEVIRLIRDLDQSRGRPPHGEKNGQTGEIEAYQDDD